MRTRQQSAHGFTLIEMMITVAIIGILAAIAYPAYQEQVRKSRRADCSGALLGLAQAMERYFSANTTYVGASLGGTAGDIYPNRCPIDGGVITYDLRIAVATASAYTVQAVPTGAQLGDQCGTLTLNQALTKNMLGAAAGLTPADCW